MKYVFECRGISHTQKVFCDDFDEVKDIFHVAWYVLDAIGYREKSREGVLRSGDSQEVVMERNGEAAAILVYPGED